MEAQELEYGFGSLNATVLFRFASREIYTHKRHQQMNKYYPTEFMYQNGVSRATVALGTTKRFKEKAAETYQNYLQHIDQRAYQWSDPSRRRNKDQPQDW
jgi:hypothetical protein